MRQLLRRSTQLFATVIMESTRGHSSSRTSVGECLRVIGDLLPALNNELHKGEQGKIAVVGGSIEYTGAPYFAAITALKLGADLAHVFCSPPAAPVIKTYSPELIVHPSWAIDSIAQWIDRFDAIVVGPGLGRSEDVVLMVTGLVEMVKARQIPIVIDGDGLFALNSIISRISGYTNAILTPNFVEFERLYKLVFPKDASIDPNEMKNGEAVRRLAGALGGITIMQKGSVDLISNGNEVAVGCVPGSPRRCGGQGDLCSGATAVFANWGKKKKDDMSLPYPIAACLAASSLTRRTSAIAYGKHGRSMTTTEMIDTIEQVIREIEGDGIQ